MKLHIQGKFGGNDERDKKADKAADKATDKSVFLF